MVIFFEFESGIMRRCMLSVIGSKNICKWVVEERKCMPYQTFVSLRKVWE